MAMRFAVAPVGRAEENTMIRLSKSLPCAVALLVLFGIAGSAQAFEVTGTVIGVGFLADSVTVMDDNRNIYNFDIMPNSNARLNGSQVQIANLRPGDRVRVLYDNRRGHLVIRQIDARR
jgi:hypothetical protein